MLDSITSLKNLIKTKKLAYSAHQFNMVADDGIDLPERRLTVAKMQYGVWPFRSYYYVAIWGEGGRHQKIPNTVHALDVNATVNISKYDSEREALMELIRRLQKDMQGLANCFGVTAPELHKRILFSIIIGTNAPDVRDAPDDFLMGSKLMRGQTQ